MQHANVKPQAKAGRNKRHMVFFKPRGWRRCPSSPSSPRHRDVRGAISRLLSSVLSGVHASLLSARPARTKGPRERYYPTRLREPPMNEARMAKPLRVNSICLVRRYTLLGTIAAVHCVNRQAVRVSTAGVAVQCYAGTMQHFSATWTPLRITTDISQTYNT